MRTFHLPSCWRIRLRFAVIGMAACMAASLLLESFFGLHIVQGYFERLGPAALLFIPERQIRLAAAGAHTGEPEVSLYWENKNDLDLHVVEPSGEHLFFAHRRSRSGGALDVDMNVQPATNRPAEHIYWPVGWAPAGTFQVLVHHFRNHGAPDPTAYRVEVRAGGRTRVYTGAVSWGEAARPVTTFTVTGTGRHWLAWLQRPGLIRLMAVCGAWAALVTSLLAWGLIRGLRRLAPAAIAKCAVWPRAAPAGGLLAGALGQAAFSVADGLLPQLSPLPARMLGFAILGLVVGATLGGNVPLLKRRESVWAGALAGAIGGWAFCGMGFALTGRLACAGVVGAAIGALICWLTPAAPANEEQEIVTLVGGAGGTSRVQSRAIRTTARQGIGVQRATRSMVTRDGQTPPRL